MNKSFFPKLALVALAVSATAAQAATTTATFQVKMVVVNGCLITLVPGDLDLGTVVAGDINRWASNNFKINCASGLAYNVGLLPSNNNANGAGVMTSGGNTQAYQLYKDAAFTQVWGNTIGTNTVSGTGAGMAVGNAITLNHYAKVTTVSAPAGTYADTVTLTVTY